MNRPRESPRNYQCIVMQGIETRLLVFASTTVDSRECRAFCRQQTPPGRQTACSTTATRRSELPRTKRMRRAGVCMRKAGSNKNKNRTKSTVVASEVQLFALPPLFSSRDHGFTRSRYLCPPGTRSHRWLTREDVKRGRAELVCLLGHRTHACTRFLSLVKGRGTCWPGEKADRRCRRSAISVGAGTHFRVFRPEIRVPCLSV